MKICTLCNQTKPYTEFRQRADRSSLTPRCKVCLNDLCKVQRQKNPEKTKELWKDYYYRERENLLIKQKLWREQNKEKVRIYQKEYKKTHPEAKRESEAKRRARVQNCSLIENVKLQQVIDRDGLICYLCLLETDLPTLDHVVPLSKGGTHTYDNVRIACGSCNSRKKDKLIAPGSYYVQT